MSSPDGTSAERGGSQVIARTPLRILHVEDNPNDAELVELCLRRGGYQQCSIVRVQTRETFLQALRENPFDMILADYSMPGFDGLTALKLASEFSPGLPFIFVSGTLGEDVAIETLKGGALDYVLKNRLSRLVPAVQRALQEQGEREKGARAEKALQRSERRFRFLAQVSVELAASFDYPSMLKSVASHCVPVLADWCAFSTAGPEGAIQVSVAHADPAKADLVSQVLARHPDPGGLHGLPGVAHNGSPLLLPEISAERLRALARDDEHAAQLREVGMNSYLCVPLCAHGKILGTLSCALASPARAYDALDLALAEDVAQRAATAVENARLYHESQEAVRSRDEFLSIASHELKTPLTSLQLEVQMLLRQARKLHALQTGGPPSASGLSLAISDALCLDPVRVVAKLEIVEQQTKKLTKLINNLLDVSRIAAGRFEIRLEEMDLSHVVREVAERFGSQFALAGCRIKLNLSSAVGHWDRLRMEQVVTNLLTNAMKYGRGKPIDITVEQRGNMARLSVRDFGIGIQAEHKSRIFERFERAALSRNYGGLGLGLYIVKQIVDALGGTVAVESELGAGALFTVELPCIADKIK